MIMTDASKAQISWRPWLPESALGEAGLDQALAEVARQWSTKWFARKSARLLSGLGEAKDPSADAGFSWRMLEGDVAIGVSALATGRLAALMLDEAVPEAPGIGDQRVIDQLTDTALQDLGRRLAETLGLSPTARWREAGDADRPVFARARRCQLGVDIATPLLQIIVSGDALVARAKSRASRGPAPARLARIAEGLAQQRTEVAARLGRCSLTLADLAGLAIGDVLVLDGRADHPVPLAVNGKTAARGSCHVQRDGEQLHLQIVEPLTF